MAQTQATRVLIVGGDDKDALSNAVTPDVYQRVNIEAGLGDVTRNGGTPPDVVILNMYGSEDIGEDRCIELAQEFKASQRHTNISIILIGPRDQITDRLKRRAGELFDEILIDPVNEEQVRRRINSLARLNTMHSELLRRLTTWKKFGVDAPFKPERPDDIEDANILVLGASPDFAVIETALASRATLVGALSCTTALDYLSRRFFDLIIINMMDDPEGVEDLCRTARRNPKLYNLPILILMDENTNANTIKAVSAGATSHLVKPLDPAELENRVFSLVREVRFREALRDIYDRARHLATSDGLTGLYSRGFLLDHLATTIKDAERSRQTFSVAFFELGNIKPINESFGYIAGDRIIRQVGEMMGMLVRGEDLMARYSGTKFAAILPATTPEAAQVALDRITGVINFTEFSFASDPEGAMINDIIRVHMSSGIAGYRGGDTPEELIGRARFICASGG